MPTPTDKRISSARLAQAINGFRDTLRAMPEEYRDAYDRAEAAVLLAYGEHQMAHGYGPGSQVMENAIAAGAAVIMIGVEL